MGANEKHQTYYLDQLSNIEGDFKHHVQSASFLFGGIIDRANESEIVEALAVVQGLNTLMYSMLLLQGHDLIEMRKKAAVLVRHAVEDNNF